MRLGSLLFLVLGIALVNFSSIESARADRIGGKAVVGADRKSSAKPYDRCTIAGIWSAPPLTFIIHVVGDRMKFKYTGIDPFGVPLRGDGSGTISGDGSSIVARGTARDIPVFGTFKISHQYHLIDGSRALQKWGDFRIGTVPARKLRPVPCFEK